MKELEFRKIDLSELKKDDILLVKIKGLHPINMEAFEKHKKYIQGECGIKNKVLFMDSNDDISIIRDK